MNDKTPETISKADEWFAKLKLMYNLSDDFKVRTLKLSKTVNVVYLDTMVTDTKVLTGVVQPLVEAGKVESAKNIQDDILYNALLKEEPNFGAMVASFLNGYSILFVEGEDVCLSADTRTQLGRAVIEPPTSIVLRGPREGFVEDIKTNLTLIRKRLKCTDFKTESVTIGKYTNTAVTVCYIDSVADSKIVNKVVQRLQSIDIDGVVDSSYLSRYLDRPKTLFFNRVGESEKPDVVVGKMLEGRIAIVVDGSPMVLTVPYLFIEDIQGPSDYQQPSEVTAMGRILRLVSVLISLMLPALFVSLQKYNYQIIPIKFLITILNATDAIPFSALAEMLIVIIIFDILREANLRMPTAVGMSLSLVGAIVLGDAAVKAGLLGAPAVMIGALSGIGLYTLPDNTLVLSLLRLVFVYIGGILGIFGILISIMALLGYMVSLQQLGTPFMAPHAPFIFSDVRQDGPFMSELSDQIKRPKSIPNTNETRRGK